MNTQEQSAHFLSAYDFKQRRITASSSSEQTSVSPGNSVKAVKLQSAPRSRPRYGHFSASEGSTTQRIRIPSAERLLEEIDLKQNQITPENEELYLSGEKADGYLVDTSAAAVDGLKKEVFPPTKLSSLRSLRLPPEPLASASAPSLKRGMKWTRSQSGSIWIRKYRAAHETSSSDNSIPSEPAGITIIPLVPPRRLSRSDMATSKTSNVRVETPFPEAKDLERPTNPAPNMSSADNSTRKLPITTTKLISTPMTALHRFIKTKPCASNLRQSSVQDTLSSPVEAQSHKSNFRRHQTTQMLNRVSSLLREGSQAPKVRRTLGRNGSDQTRSHQDMQSRSRTATFETIETATSSIRKMQMGSTPLNSVLDTATYKVKRSPSQATEEYLAIDISIRGGTSYLPSEARRIHTPPLPDDDVINNIHKQGFVFDYYHCSSSKACNSVSQQSNDLTVVPGRGRKSSQDIDDKIEPVTSTTSALLSYNPSSRQKSYLSQSKSYASFSEKAETAKEENSSEWLETQIADMDALMADVGMSSSQPTTHPTPLGEPSIDHRVKKRVSRDHHQQQQQQQQQQYLDQLDWTIPEHLPTSPLCPRHPRY